MARGSVADDCCTTNSVHSNTVFSITRLSSVFNASKGEICSTSQRIARAGGDVTLALLLFSSRTDANFLAAYKHELVGKKRSTVIAGLQTHLGGEG